MPSVVRRAPSANPSEVIALVTKWIPRLPVLGSTTWILQFEWTGDGQSARSGPRSVGPKWPCR